MRVLHIESLEQRQLFHAALPVNPALSAAQVEQMLGQAGSQARPTQAIVIVDRSGNVLGEYDGSALSATAGMTPQQLEEQNEIRLDAALRARTAAFFQSQGEAFTTRTARFIIQDHFPSPVKNTGGGPLYGVQFSSTASTDTIPIDTTTGNSPFLVPDVTATGLINTATGAAINGSPLIDALGPAGLSGDPGGIPLYVMGIDSITGKVKPFAVGAIGVAGDFSDVAARKNLLLGNTLLTDGTHEFQYAADANPSGHFYQGSERSDFDESVAEAGATGFMAPRPIQAGTVFVAGLRLPFLASPVARRDPKQSLSALIAQGAGTEPVTFTAAPSPSQLDDSHVRDTPQNIGLNSGLADPTVTVKGVDQHGMLDRRNTRADPTQLSQNYGFVDSNDADPATGELLSTDDRLTARDVGSVISAAIDRAVTVRAGIRQPIGANAVVYISVVDRDGDLLGVYRMGDATNFSYDVSVQKARTAAYFSDNAHAFSDTAIGFLSQHFFPIGINDAQEGPLYELQNGLKTGDVNSLGQVVDDTQKPIGIVTSAVSAGNVTTAVIAASMLGSSTFHVGEIVTLGTDPTFAARVAADPGATSDNDSANEYLITSVTTAGITVRSDGIDPSATGPIALLAGEAILPKNPLKNGITIFPGGFPLYKNGQMVGAIGVSGDGVTQDDIIAYSGTGATTRQDNGVTNFRPPMKDESDALTTSNVASFIGSKVQSIEDTFELGSAFTSGLSYTDAVSQAQQRIEYQLPLDRLPYAKFPRNPFI